MDWEQIAAFLSDEDVPPIPESIRSGDEESLAIAEVAARMCYMSYGRGRRDIADFINNLLSSKDGSVFEHINYGFIFTGVSRSLTHELVRHRAGFSLKFELIIEKQSAKLPGQYFPMLPRRRFLLPVTFAPGDILLRCVVLFLPIGRYERLRF